jgi:ABC-2 type transport system ATP-binding protein
VSVAEPVIRVENVSKFFSLHKHKSLKERLVNRGRDPRNQFWALRDISFDVPPASTLALVGHNGSGKSTLLKIIGGILAPSTGFAQRRGRLAALLELGAGFHGDLTGRENVYLNASILGLTRAQTDHYFDAIVDFSGIEEFIDTQVKFYSSGMYVRLAFAVAIHVDPEVLLVDEVLAVGDEPFQRKCLEKIRDFQREGRTIVMVTHGLDQVRQMCDRAILLEHGKMLIDGSPVDTIRMFREKYEQDFEANAGEPDVDQLRPAEIVSVHLGNPDGSTARRLDPDDPLTIDVVVRAHQPQPAWTVGIAINNQFEANVYGFNTFLAGVDLGPLEGTKTVRFAIPEVPLVEGQYFVTAAVHPPRGAEWHRVDRAAFFKVYSPSNEVGVVHLRPRIEVIR